MRTKSIIIKSLVSLFIVILAVGYFSHGFAAGGYKLLQNAAENSSLNSAKILLTFGAPASPYKEIYNWYYLAALTDTPLHSASKLGNIEFVNLLIENGASLDWCCCSCVTPLHEAIKNKNIEIVKILLKSGSSTEILYDTNMSALELARSQSNDEIIKVIETHNQALNIDLGDAAHPSAN